MTALEIIQALKKNRQEDAVLWINHDRRQACYADTTAPANVIPVNYNDAVIARSDPEIVLVEHRDGEIYVAR